MKGKTREIDMEEWALTSSLVWLSHRKRHVRLYGNGSMFRNVQYVHEQNQYNWHLPSTCSGPAERFLVFTIRWSVESEAA